MVVAPLPPQQVPDKFNNGTKISYVFDQLQLGSCTANGIALSYDFCRVREGYPIMQPSRLFIYWNERNAEGTISTDSGAQVRDGIKSLNSLGVCAETLWTYDPTQFAVKPPDRAFTAALNNMLDSYAPINLLSANVIKSVIANSEPFPFGFTVFESFESDEVAASGVVPMPDINNEGVLGGHCVSLIGYDDTMIANGITGYYRCRNSWGKGWGDGGDFYLPYQFVNSGQFCSDAWNLKVAKILALSEKQNAA